MDLPTYPSGSRPTVAGLVKSGRLKPRPVPSLGRHSDEREDHPQAVSVADLVERVADTHVVRWFTAQQASDTRRIERVALPAVGGVA